MAMRIATAGVVALAAVAWASLLVITPWLAAPGAGEASVFTAALVFRTGAVICHQHAGRSFAHAGIQEPVCARCTGLYAGAAAGALAVFLVIAARTGRTRDRRGLLAWPLTRLRWAVIACGLPTLVTWAVEHAAGAPVTNLMRAATALPLGAAVAAIVVSWAAGASFDDTPAATAIH
ncbi:MAG: DUF2085 domain-containing protein [Acidobacteria bacterium]|nr:DUF2085 domain-containing protein [Acidobacteriota bacterium]